MSRRNGSAAPTATEAQEFQRYRSGAARHNVGTAIQRVAARLGNSVAIRRARHFHPQVLGFRLYGALPLEIGTGVGGELRAGTSRQSPREAAALACPAPSRVA